MHSNLLKVDSVPSAFGHAFTAFNLDASFFTQYTELQFDQRGRMVGILHVLSGVRTVILPIIDREACKLSSDEATTAKFYENHLDSGVLVSATSKKISHAFGVQSPSLRR